MKLGFIGTGAIAEHMITGLNVHGGYEAPIIVSERNRERSSRLAAQYSNVSIEADSQSIVDQVDTVFVATLPPQTLELMSALRFRDDQTVVSLAAMISVEQIAETVTPASQIHRIIPMPPCEIGQGPIPIYPPSPHVEALLSRIGTVIPIDDESQFSTFSASSAVMATFFELIATNARWIQSTGVSAEAATRYSTAVFHALATQVKELGAQELQRVSTECVTVGGLNEQLLNATRSEGWFDELSAELDRILKRVS